MGLLKIITAPFRLGRTVRKAGGSKVAGVVPGGSAEVQTAKVSPYTFLFSEIGRPKLPLVSASEFDLPAAKRLRAEADAFYSRPFALFPSGTLFYEEVEREELAASLGQGEDAGFTVWAEAVRKTLNDNERRLFLYYTPMVLTASAALGWFLRPVMPPILHQATLPVVGAVPPAALAWPTAMLAGLFVLALLYHWPYKFAQQRNLLGFDNTITSRFSQLNQNFLVAKRRALNVERDKRMNQVEALQDEAATWTLAYQWLALRLYLSERLVRNQMYQVNRNAKLYAVGGFVLCLSLVGLGDAMVSHILGKGVLTETLWSLGAGLSFAALAYGVVMAGAAGEAARVLSDNEWFRFSRIELDRAVAEHVGEDKLQIVTFRDRNRFE